MTLSTSVTDAHRQEAAGTALIYLSFSLFCALFGAIYEYFSHGVFSFYMIYAFLLPLAGGALPYTLFGLGKGPYPTTSTRWLAHAGIAALTVGCIMKGVLEIYGTTNSLTRLYPLTGLPMLALATLLYLTHPRKKAH